jgi:hypothetical protein
MGLSMGSSIFGFLRGRPYVVRLVEAHVGKKGSGEWLVEMPGIPPVMFPQAAGDSDITVRRTAEGYLALLLPEEPATP